jgi:hypothetical protein
VEKTNRTGNFLDRINKMNRKGRRDGINKIKMISKAKFRLPALFSTNLINHINPINSPSARISLIPFMFS